MDMNEIIERLNDYVPMTLEEAKRRREVFMDRYGNALAKRVNETWPLPDGFVVSREEFEAVEEAFQHWPLRDENGEECVGNTCFRDPKIPYEHVMFKGIPITYDKAAG